MSIPPVKEPNCINSGTGGIDMTNLQERLNLAKNISDTAAQEKERVRKEIEAMRASIFAGETTGNVIQDYMIAKFGVIDETACERYEAINALLKGKVGEMIVIHHIESECRVHRFIGPNDYEDVEYTSIAILTGDELAFTLKNNEARCTLPITVHADQKFRWKITKGTISEVHAGKIFMAKDCGNSFRISSVHPGDWRPLFLEIGDEAAMSWIDSKLYDFRRNKPELTLLFERLGRLTLSVQEDDQDESAAQK